MTNSSMAWFLAVIENSDFRAARSKSHYTNVAARDESQFLELHGQRPRRAGETSFIAARAGEIRRRVR